MMPLCLNTSRMTQMESGVNIVLSSCCRIAVELLSLFGVSYLLQGLEGWVPPLPTPTRAKTTRASGTPAPHPNARKNHTRVGDPGSPPQRAQKPHARVEDPGSG